MKRLFLVLGLALQLHGAIAGDATAFLGKTTGTSQTTAFTTSGSNRLLLVAIIGDNSNDFITGVTYNGVSMTLVKKNPPGDRYQYIYCLAAPASGSNNIVISASSSQTIYGFARSYTGAQQDCNQDFTPATGSTPASPCPACRTLTITGTTVTTGDWLFMIMGGYDGGTPVTAGTGTTRTSVDTSGDGIGAIFDSNGTVSPGSNSLQSVWLADAAVVTTGIMIGVCPASACTSSGAVANPSVFGIAVN